MTLLNEHHASAPARKPLSGKEPALDSIPVRAGASALSRSRSRFKVKDHCVWYFDTGLIYVPHHPSMVPADTFLTMCTNVGEGGRTLTTLGRYPNDLVSYLGQLKADLFVGLTLPADYPQEMKTVKQAFDSFRDRFGREWPSVGAVWVCDWRDRPSDGNMGRWYPHWHILLFNGAELDAEAMHGWIKHHWNDALRASFTSAGHVEPTAETPICQEAVRGYMVKQTRVLPSCEEEAISLQWGQDAGRRKGIWNRASMPYSAPQVQHVTASEYRAIRRRVEREVLLQYTNNGMNGKLSINPSWKRLTLPVGRPSSLIADVLSSENTSSTESRSEGYLRIAAFEDIAE